MVKTYDKKKDINKQLSKNFKLNEFDCKCSRCSTVLLDDKLVDILQDIRDHFNAPLNVNSGYRCKEHNTEVGGNPGSHHMKGMAADIRVNGVDPAEIAKYAESINVKRIGLYEGADEGNFVHIGSADTKSFWKGHASIKVDSFGGNPIKEDDKQTTKANTITLTLPILKRGAKGGAVYGLQTILRGCGHEIEIDGSFGPATETAVKMFQFEYDLAVDGSVGPDTWKGLLNI